MRKKSHISLAGQIMNSLEIEGILKHKMTFYMGNVLPDCKPSFLTTPHSFDETFERISSKMETLISGFDPVRGITMTKTIHLGEVSHYIADYFTFPHNKHYDGSLKDHCCYEGDLKRRLREYINSGHAMDLKNKIETFSTIEELLDYIKSSHSAYMSAKRSIREDMEYIIVVCTSVIASILQMCCRLTEELIKKPKYVFAS